MTARIEASLERRFRRECKKRGVWALKTEHLFPGFPDRMLLGPGRKIAFVELKTPGGALRPAQKRVFSGLLARLGWTVEVIAEVEHALLFLEKWLNQERINP